MRYLNLYKYFINMAQYLRDLSAVSKEEMDVFLSSFDTVLSDCDGVLWYHNSPIEGSIDVVNRLKALGKKVFLVSNNCTITLDEYMAKITKYGLNVTKEDIIIPSIVTTSYLKEVDFNRKVFLLGSPAFKDELLTNGFHCSSDIGPDHSVNSAGEFVKEMEAMDKDVGAVVIDFDFGINYVKLMKALFHLKKPECLFIGGASDIQIPVGEGVHLIGPGSFLATLELLSGRKAVLTGKPSPYLKEFISKRHTFVPERTLMIGDMLTLDIKFATNCGFQSLLVLSGISKLEDTENDKTNLPHYYLKKLGDLLPLMPST